MQYRTVPRGELGGRVPTLVHAVLESRVDGQAADRGRRAADMTGGWSWFVAPGLPMVTLRPIVEAAVELPVTQPDDRHVDFIAPVSRRGSFGCVPRAWP